MSRTAGLMIVGVASVALALKLWLALTTYGTNDVLYFEHFLATANTSGGIGLYRGIWYFTHLPFMIHALKGLGWLASVTGLPFPFWVRLPSILADVGSLFLVWRLVGGTGNDPGDPVDGTVRTRSEEGRCCSAPLILMAASPASILISGFHGNTDAVMIFFVLLAVFLIERGVPAPAGAALGMALNIKLLPLIYLPAMLAALPTRGRWWLAGTSAGVLLGGSMPYLAQDGSFILGKVLGYTSLYGHWGVTRLTAAGGSQRIIRVTLLALIAVGIVLVARSGWPLFSQVGAVTFLFLALTPGFGVQYLAWGVPWVAALGVWPSLAYAVTSGAFLFVVYDYWSRGSWYFANSDVVGDWQGTALIAELVCWFSVVAVTALFFRKETADGKVYRHEDRVS